MTKWLSIDSCPINDWSEINNIKVLLYDPEIGIRIGYGVKWDDDEPVQFQYDCDGFKINPTHWMPLPQAPTEELVPFETKEIQALKKIAKAVDDLNFGSSIALPWCIESFPKLNEALKEWKDILKKEQK